MRRRRFFKVSIVGGVVLSALSAGGLLLRKGDYGEGLPLPSSFYVLDPTSYWVLVAAIQRISLVNKGLAMEIAEEVDAALSFGARSSGRDVVRVLRLLENGLTGLFFRFSPRLFTEMNEAEQDRALAAWRDSKFAVLRGAYQGVRRLVHGVHYSCLQRSLATGYPGPPFEKQVPLVIRENEPLSPEYLPKVIRSDR